MNKTILALLINFNQKKLNKMVEKIIISYMRGYSSATTSPEIGKPF